MASCKRDHCHRPLDFRRRRRLFVFTERHGHRLSCSNRPGCVCCLLPPGPVAVGHSIAAFFSSLARIATAPLIMAASALLQILCMMRACIQPHSGGNELLQSTFDAMRALILRRGQDAANSQFACEGAGNESQQGVLVVFSPPPPSPVKQVNREETWQPPLKKRHSFFARRQLA